MRIIPTSVSGYIPAFVSNLFNRPTQQPQQDAVTRTEEVAQKQLENPKPQPSNQGGQIQEGQIQEGRIQEGQIQERQIQERQINLIVRENYPEPASLQPTPVSVSEPSTEDNQESDVESNSLASQDVSRSDRENSADVSRDISPIRDDSEDLESDIKIEVVTVKTDESASAAIASAKPEIEKQALRRRNPPLSSSPLFQHRANPESTAKE